MFLDPQIAYVWSNPWSVGSMLFFINRYVPFIDTFLSLARACFQIRNLYLSVMPTRAFTHSQVFEKAARSPCLPSSSPIRSS